MLLGQILFYYYDYDFMQKLKAIYLFFTYHLDATVLCGIVNSLDWAKECGERPLSLSSSGFKTETFIADQPHHGPFCSSPAYPYELICRGKMANRNSKYTSRRIAHPARSPSSCF